jgi:hypothetical protein
MNYPSGVIDRTSSSDEKIRLFRSLFRGRDAKQYVAIAAGNTIYSFAWP